MLEEKAALPEAALPEEILEAVSGLLGAAVGAEDSLTKASAELDYIDAHRYTVQNMEYAKHIQYM